MWVRFYKDEFLSISYSSHNTRFTLLILLGIINILKFHLLKAILKLTKCEKHI